MNDRIKWIEYKGKRILFLDYSNLYGEEYRKTIEQARDFIIGSGEHDLIVLQYVENSFLDKETFELGKKVSREVKDFVSKAAVVGARKTHEIFMKTLKSFSDADVKPFNTIEDVKECLIKYNFKLTYTLIIFNMFFKYF